MAYEVRDDSYGVSVIYNANMYADLLITSLSSSEFKLDAP